MGMSNSQKKMWYCFWKFKIDEKIKSKFREMKWMKFRNLCFIFAKKKYIYRYVYLYLIIEKCIEILKKWNDWFLIWNLEFEIFNFSDIKFR
jgi:hypothetical protein